MSTVAHFFIIIVAQKFVITWLTFSLTFTQEVRSSILLISTIKNTITTRFMSRVVIFFRLYAIS